MVDPQDSDTPPSSGQRSWLAHREASSQRRFEQQTVDAATRQSRQADVRAPDGRRYYVRTVANGEFLRSVGSDGGSGLGIVVEPAVLLFEAARRHRRRGWTIGVVRAGTAWKGEKVMLRETIEDETAIAQRVRELASQIEQGTIPSGA